MNSIPNPRTAQIPSGFAMPTCGHQPLVVDAVASTCTTGVVVRDRWASIEGRRGLAMTHRPGTSARRPPTC